MAVDSGDSDDGKKEICRDWRGENSGQNGDVEGR